MAFKYSTQNGVKAPDSAVVRLLDEIENLPFPFAGLHKLKDLRRQTGVSVIISDRSGLMRILDDAIKSVENKIAEYNKSGHGQNGNVEGEVYRQRNWAQRQRELAEHPQEESLPLLGLYSRKLFWLDSAPVVYLFADNIFDYAGHRGMDATNVFGFVFIHEMMHAYYDAFNNEGFHAKERLEEAFAEFGMLSFLQHSFGPAHALFSDARKSVGLKIANGPREYGFGLKLFEMSGSAGDDMIIRYRDISNWIDYDILVRSFPSLKLGNYFYDIEEFKEDPSEGNAEKCFHDVQDILDYDWTEPRLHILPSIRSRASGRAHSGGPSANWAITCTPLRTINQVRIVSEKKIELLFTAIIRILKSVGGESALSFEEDFDGGDVFYVKFRDDFLFYGSLLPSSPDPDFFVVSEGVRIDGTIVFPLFPWIKANEPTVSERLVRLLSEITGETITLTKEASRFTLYASQSGFAHFASSIPASGTKPCFDIVVKVTSEEIGKHVPMSKVPFLVVRHFCSVNRGISYATLQKVFNGIRCSHLPNHLGLVALESDVDAYYASLKARGMRKKARFVTEPILLDSGEIIFVTNQWVLSDSSGAFLEIADHLGYEILMH